MVTNHLNFHTMSKNITIYLIFIGLMGLSFACQKEDAKVTMLSTLIAPTIQTVPDLTLKRANGTDSLTFVGTAVNPGFTASVNYFLEVDTAGNQFSNPTILATDIQDALIKFSISDLNKLFIKRFPTDVVSSLELRIRSVLVTDAGTGAVPIVSISATKAVSVTTYGFPRLDLIVGTSVIGKIESALGDGSYTGFVKLDKTEAFTFKDPDANIVYGANGGALAVNGTSITSGDNGWYKFTVDTEALTYSMDAYFIGLVGDATANGWSSPDTKMDYNSKTATWYITTALTDGTIKFRLNDGWAINWGGKGTSDGSTDNYTDATTVPLATGGKNIGLTGGAGTYTITLDISGLTATVVKN
jgi:starch-binding outer membrane protein SusE/F